MLKVKKSVEAKKNIKGFLFICPWIFGVLTFIIVPLIKSVAYSFSEVSIGEEGNIVTDFIGVVNFKNLLTVDPNFLENLKDSVISFLYSMPIILVLSLLFAVVLNQNFKGRFLARSIFFLPVIISTGVVMEILTSSIGKSAIISNVSTTTDSAFMGGLIDFNLVLKQLNFPTSITELFSKYFSIIFDLVWSCGIQIVLFISGLQTIPPQLYEVSRVEGATKWEEFWFITIPMLRNVILLVMVYTTIDLFVSNDNTVITQAMDAMNVMKYGESAAMLWLYFVIAGAIASAFMFVYYRFCMKRWD